MGEASENLSKVALDTSLLLSIPRQKIHVFKEIKERLGRVSFFVPRSVLRELESVAERKRKKRDLQIVKKLLKLNRVKVIENNCVNADDCLLGKAFEGFLVATNDSELRKKIKGFGGRIIYLKKRKLVEIE